MALLDIVADRAGVRQSRGGAGTVADIATDNAGMVVARAGGGTVSGIVGTYAVKLSRGDVGTLLGVLSADLALLTQPSAVGSGLLKVWEGLWLSRAAKVWNGAGWVAKPIKVWDGAVWKMAN